MYTFVLWKYTLVIWKYTFVLWTGTFVPSTLKIFFCTSNIYIFVLWELLFPRKVYFCSLKVYFCTRKIYIFFYFESIPLYSESILLYFARMLASGCIDNQYIKGKENLVINIHFRDALFCWGYHLGLFFGEFLEFLPVIFQCLLRRVSAFKCIGESW